MLRSLPRGIALVRIDTPVGTLLWVSDRLSESEASVARIIAVVHIRLGAKAVVLRETEVTSTIETA